MTLRPTENTDFQIITALSVAFSGAVVKHAQATKDNPFAGKTDSIARSACMATWRREQPGNALAASVRQIVHPLGQLDVEVGHAALVFGG